MSEATGVVLAIVVSPEVSSATELRTQWIKIVNINYTEKFQTVKSLNNIVSIACYYTHFNQLILKYYFIDCLTNLSLFVCIKLFINVYLYLLMLVQALTAWVLTF
jgi:hypothetical protein